MMKICVSWKNQCILCDREGTRSRPNIQENPGARTLDAIVPSHRQHHITQLDCNDGEVALILFFSGWGVCPLPMIVVPVFEYAPFRVVRKLRNNCGAVKALIHRREFGFSRKFIDDTVGCECRVGEPVTDHNPRVAENQLIEPVNDHLRTRRHEVGVFECNHSSGNIKLNIHGVDGIPISPMSLQPLEENMSGESIDDNGTASF